MPWMQGGLHRLGVPQDGRGRRQMAARREAADGDFRRVGAELLCIAADMQDRPGSVDQRLPTQRGHGLVTSAGVIEGKNVVTSLQKLHGNGVGLAPAAPGVAAARQDENGRTGVEGRHLDGPIAQIPDELCAAGESVGVYLHDGFFFLLYFYGKGSFFVGRA